MLNSDIFSRLAVLDRVEGPVNGIAAARAQCGGFLVVDIYNIMLTDHFLGAPYPEDYTLRFYGFFADESHLIHRGI